MAMRRAINKVPNTVPTTMPATALSPVSLWMEGERVELGELLIEGVGGTI